MCTGTEVLELIPINMCKQVTLEEKNIAKEQDCALAGGKHFCFCFNVLALHVNHEYVDLPQRLGYPYEEHNK